MKIVAILCQRNGEAYIGRCLDHLASQGIEVYVMDNGSTDDSARIARSMIGRGVIGVEDVPFDGVFRLSDILRRKEALAAELDGDWFMHHDVDEIREAPPSWGTLAEAVAAVDAEGFNAIEFDEFVFVPVDGEDFEGRDHVAAMRHYYHFRPRPMHRLNLWKNTGAPVDLVSGFGHRVRFEGIRPCPTPFVLRHYVALSRAHVVRKFASRVHGVERIARTSWDDPRVAFDPRRVRMPERGELIEYRDDRVWDRSRPRATHPFLEQPGPNPPEAEAEFEVEAVEGAADSWDADVAGASGAILVGAPGSGLERLRAMFSAAGLRILSPERVAAGGLRRALAASPDVPVIHLVRDGRSIAGETLASHEDAGGGSEVSRAVEDLAVEWMWHVRQIRQQFQLAEHRLELRYEELIADPDSAFARLGLFLDVTVDPAESLVPDPADGVTRPAEPALSDQDRLRFEHMAGELLAELGYR